MNVAIAFKTLEAAALFIDLAASTGKTFAMTWAKLQMEEAEAITLEAIQERIDNIPTTEELAERYDGV